MIYTRKNITTCSKSANKPLNRLQPCVVNLVTFLLYHDCIRLVRATCNRSDNANKLVTSC